MATIPDNPLAGPPPPEIPLPSAPLIRVIAQVRFPLVTSVLKQEFIAPFQEAVRIDYAVLRAEQSRTVIFGSDGAAQQSTGVVWRFEDVDRGWRLSLAPDFLALETTRYVSRDNFLARFERVLVALRDHIDPPVIDRLGLRYIDRVVGDDVPGVLPDLMRPEIAGILRTPLAGYARHAIVENVFSLPEGTGNLMARWGLVPKSATVDPSAIEPTDQPSWLLDLDAFLTETRPFEIDAIVAETRGFAERIYSFFRWVVTKKFIERYGGRP